MKYRQFPRLLCLAVIGIPLILYSQTYLSRSYTVTDGLASPTVNDITQDITGKMWFATTVGVSCYDGTTWINYSTAQGLPMQEYFKIFPDRDGAMWALTRYLENGIYVLKHESKRWFHILPPGDITGHAVYCTAAARLETPGKIYIGIGTNENGLYIYSPNDWQCPEPGKEQAHLHILALTTHEQCFYAAVKDPHPADEPETGQGNVFMIRPQQPRQWLRKEFNTPTPQVYSLSVEQPAADAPDSGNSPETRIWLTGKKWAGYVDGKRFHKLFAGDFPGYKDEAFYQRVLTLPDSFGGLWIAGKQVLLNLDPQGRVLVMGIPEPLKVTGAYCLFRDRETNFWYGTHRGVVKITTFRFENYRKKDGLYDDEVSAVAQMENGEMIFGHNGGFTFFKENNFKILKVPGFDPRITSDSRVLDICLDREGNAWAAVSRAGIVKITPTKQMEWYKMTPAGKIPPEKMDIIYSSVLLDSTGKLWACGDKYILTMENRRLVPRAIEMEDERFFRRIFQDMENTLYFTSEKDGLVRMHNNILEKINCLNNEEANSTYSLFRTPGGDVLVGTKVGLYRLENNTLVKYRHRALQIDKPVYFITPDRDGNIWFGLNEGVIRWDGSQARHYGPNEGLVGHETNRAAGFIDQSGRLWIGTEKGVSCYYKEKDRINQTPPLMELLYLEVSGQLQQYPLNHDLEFNYRLDDLIFHFRGISFIDENNVRYNLKLEGVDNEWLNNYQVQQNQMRYLNVSPGKYRFHIQAVNSLGIKSPILSSGLITINNPWYKTWWFFLLLLIMLILLIYFTANYISRKQYASHLEEQIHLRTRRLEESERELREIFNNAHDAILVIDPGTETVLNANPRTSDIYGFPLEEFIGMSLETISKDVKRGKEKIIETLQAGDCLSFETLQFRKDGSEMFLEVNASIINYRGKLAILSINRDISERKRSEQQIKNSLHEKEILLKEIHHRVKNNLQIVSSLLDLQADTLENSEVIKVFQDSKNRVHSMALVHENLYRFGDLARIDGIAYVNKLVDNLFDTYGDLAENIASEINIELSSFPVDMDTAIPLGLIITELTTNALKHAFPSYREGLIRVTLKSLSPGTVMLTVSDNGVGLPGEIDLQESKTLGMQLVFLLSQQLKGTITFEKKNGTMVTITFPYTGELHQTIREIED